MATFLNPKLFKTLSSTSSFKLLLFFIACMPALQAQTGSAKPLSLVEKLRLTTRVESAHIGFAGTKSNSYQTAEELWKESSVLTLTKLTDDTSPVVRCYAFLGLLQKKADPAVIKGVLEKHRNDTTTVSTMSGCIVMSGQTVIDYMSLHAGVVNTSKK